MVECGILKPGPDHPHVKHSLIQTSLVFIQQLHGLLRTKSTAVVLTCACRERVYLPVKTRLGFDGALGALARLFIPRFQQKAKQNRRAARVCGYIAIVFISRTLEGNEEDNEAPKQPGSHSSSGGRCQAPRSISSFAATASTISSSHGRPTICTPIGKPKSEYPIGTTAAGKPRTLNHSQ